MVMMVMSCSDHIVTIANASNLVKRICAEFETTAHYEPDEATTDRARV